MEDQFGSAVCVPYSTFSCLQRKGTAGVPVVTVHRRARAEVAAPPEDWRKLVEPEGSDYKVRDIACPCFQIVIILGLAFVPEKEVEVTAR